MATIGTERMITAIGVKMPLSARANHDSEASITPISVPPTTPTAATVSVEIVGSI